MYFRSPIARPNRHVGRRERCLSVKHLKRRSFSFSALIKRQEAWGHTVLCGKLCDHGNVVRQRHYWSDPYRGLAYSLPNQAFRSPTTTTRKTFQILFSSRVVSIDKRSVPLCKSKSIALFFFSNGLKLKCKPWKLCIYYNHQVEIGARLFVLPTRKTAACLF